MRKLYGRNQLWQELYSRSQRFWSCQIVVIMKTNRIKNKTARTWFEFGMYAALAATVQLWKKFAIDDGDDDDETENFWFHK